MCIWYIYKSLSYLCILLYSYYITIYYHNTHNYIYFHIVGEHDLRFFWEALLEGDGDSFHGTSSGVSQLNEDLKWATGVSRTSAMEGDMKRSGWMGFYYTLVAFNHEL